AGVATAGSTVTLSAELPATGTNYNKVVVTGFQTGASASTLNFTLQVQLYSLGGSYNPVPLQSEITGLVAPFGPNDLSNDPTSITADDATVITFCPNITLPVKLLSFTGTYKNNATSLNWTAENQTNFAFYEIERSENGTDYSSITIKAAQQSGAARVQYQYTDDLTTATGNVFYYRLKMVDIDGQFKYSNIILVRKGQKAINGISISPNPLISGDMATVRFEAAAKATVDFKVVDIAGRVVLTQQNNAIEGTNSVAINNLDRLQPGLYVLQMNDGTAVQTTKFTIARK
ncbi:MAG: T9SS type A sorting domain-containing protein, partial [Chitinophagaceae bacterium]